MTKTISLFGLPLTDADSSTAIAAMLNRPGRTTAAFLNAHCVNSASRDRAYTRALRAANFILPDGSGISLAAKLIGKKFTENLNGTDLCRPLCEEAKRRGLSIYLLGAKPGTAEKAARNLVGKVPGLKIAGLRDGNVLSVIERIGFQRRVEHGLEDFDLRVRTREGGYAIESGLVATGSTWNEQYLFYFHRSISQRNRMSSNRQTPGTALSTLTSCPMEASSIGKNT